ncbi:MAG: hypothetical protein KC931_19380, partial [Candidatus Omnitrophica bacterium]|nr:hypothetical protein [Candidatus Omnitrophota bacterium]
MYLPGIFNETFDTVLYKPETRDQQLYRFACELICCIIHEQEIRLTEPLGTDQYFIIRLLDEHHSECCDLHRVVDHFKIVPKPGGGRVLPLAESSARNLLNSNYDFSCLDDRLEQGPRRELVAAYKEIEPEALIPGAIQFLKDIVVHASAEDAIAIAYWDRILSEGLAHQTDDGEKIVDAWNHRRNKHLHRLPSLILGNYTPHPRMTTMGQTVVSACSERRPAFWHQCIQFLDYLKGEALSKSEDAEARSKVEKEHEPASYFNFRSKFYTARDQWSKELKPEDFLFLKEMLDTTYNELTAHTTHSGHRVFMAGDPTSEDQVEAQRLITEELQHVNPANHFSLAYATDPTPWTWKEFLEVVRALEEALGDEAFTTARAAYNAAADLESRRSTLERLQDPLNRCFEPAGVSMVINYDPSFTITVSVAKGTNHEVVLVGRDDPESAETAHGEARHL